MSYHVLALCSTSIIPVYLSYPTAVERVTLAALMTVPQLLHPQSCCLLQGACEMAEGKDNMLSTSELTPEVQRF